MQVSATQVDYIEANQRLTLAHAAADQAAARHRAAEAYLRAAWNRMTSDEQQAVDAALGALNEPETAR